MSNPQVNMGASPISGKCVRCGGPIENIYTGDQGGVSHPKCYRKAHPFYPKQTFKDVVFTWEDPPLARDLMMEFVCESDQKRILDAFNERMQVEWLRGIQ